MIKVESTHDTPEQVLAAQAGKVEKEGDEPGVKAQEAEESGASEPVSADGADETVAQEAAGEESETSQDEDAVSEGKGQKKNKFQARINELTKRRKESDQKYQASELEIARLRAELAKRDGKSEESGVATKKETKVSDGKPVIDDFETMAEYYEAVADWKYEQKEAAKKKDADEKALRSEQQTHLDRYNQNLNELKKSNADVDEVFDAVSDIGMPVMLQQAIVESKFNAEIAYELSKNRDLLEEMCDMSYASVHKVIGRLEAKIEERKAASSPKKEEKKVTSAPAPITPVKTKGSGSAKSIFDPNLDQREYEKIRRAAADA